MKKKTLVLIGIAVCAILLTSPVLASAGYSKIYGNANEDDVLDMRDVTYIKLVIFGKKPATDFADANYDGKISMLDIGQTKLIILGKEKELTIIDSVDRIVTVKKPLRRIVLTHPHVLETLRAIKVPKDIIVGYAAEKMDTAFFSEFSDVPSIGWRWTPTVEEVIKLKPDAVIIFGRAHVNLDPVQDVLESTGITVLRFCCNDRNTYPDEVEKLGYIFDKHDEAEELLDWRENILNSIKEKIDTIPEEDNPKVYFETGFSDESYSVYGMYNYADIAMAGGKDIFDEEVNGVVNPEAVVDRNPDIIIKLASWEVGGYDVDAEDTAELEEAKTEVMSRDILQNTPAVKDKKIHIMTVHVVSFYPVSGCRDFIKIAYMAKWLHPDRFDDLNPKAIHQEYLTRFQGLDIDLNEKGVFVYPEEPIRVEGI
jgi:iron complex transport system substrate-binding protein